VPIAAVLPYPWFGLLRSRVLEAFAIPLSSVCVVTNALRPSATLLYRYSCFYATFRPGDADDQKNSAPNSGGGVLAT
jgi:hypothetical protein